MINTSVGEEIKPVIRKHRILQMLQAAPEGLTTVEVAAGLGANSRDVGARLGKLAAYGEIEKQKGLSPPKKARWLMKSI
jgi:hypothetical protein